MQGEKTPQTKAKLVPQSINRFGEPMRNIRARLPVTMVDELGDILAQRHQTFTDWIFWVVRDCIEKEKKGTKHEESTSPYDAEL